MKHFILNGEHYYVQTSNVYLSNLMTYFNYNESLLVLELNKFIYNKNKWQNVFISDQDKIEVVTIVGGG